MTSTRIRDINAALITAYKALNLGLVTAYEVRDFTPPAGQAWAQVFNLLGDGAPATLGNAGDDEYSGIFQINVYVPENTGTGVLHQHTDALLTYFKAGRRFTYNGQEVVVRRGSPSPIRRNEEGASFLTSVSIYWLSRSQR